MNVWEGGGTGGDWEDEDESLRTRRVERELDLVLEEKDGR